MAERLELSSNQVILIYAAYQRDKINGREVPVPWLNSEWMGAAFSALEQLATKNDVVLIPEDELFAKTLLKAKVILPEEAELLGLTIIREKGHAKKEGAEGNGAGNDRTAGPGDEQHDDGKPANGVAVEHGTEPGDSGNGDSHVEDVTPSSE